MNPESVNRSPECPAASGIHRLHALEFDFLVPPRQTASHRGDNSDKDDAERHDEEDGERKPTIDERV